MFTRATLFLQSLKHSQIKGDIYVFLHFEVKFWSFVPFGHLQISFWIIIDIHEILSIQYRIGQQCNGKSLWHAFELTVNLKRKIFKCDTLIHYQKPWWLNMNFQLLLLMLLSKSKDFNSKLRSNGRVNKFIKSHCSIFSLHQSWKALHSI